MIQGFDETSLSSIDLDSSSENEKYRATTFLEPKWAYNTQKPRTSTPIKDYVPLNHTFLEDPSRTGSTLSYSIKKLLDYYLPYNDSQYSSSFDTPSLLRLSELTYRPYRSMGDMAMYSRRSRSLPRMRSLP